MKVEVRPLSLTHHTFTTLDLGFKYTELEVECVTYEMKGRGDTLAIHKRSAMHR